jgi:hypothetical protein
MGGTGEANTEATCIFASAWVVNFMMIQLLRKTSQLQITSTFNDYDLQARRKRGE